MIDNENKESLRWFFIGIQEKRIEDKTSSFERYLSAMIDELKYNKYYLINLRDKLK